jgi:hypothetical protein
MNGIYLTEKVRSESIHRWTACHQRLKDNDMDKITVKMESSYLGNTHRALASSAKWDILVGIKCHAPEPFMLFPLVITRRSHDEHQVIRHTVS